MGFIRAASRCSMLMLAVVLTAGGACSSSKNDAAGSGGNGGAVGSGGGAGGRVGGAAGGGGGGNVAALTVTSTALAEGQTFPDDHTCAGANTSPPLTWTAGPAGTLSYAVTLTDQSISVIHWVIWDVSSATTSLPAALPNDASIPSVSGAKQAHHVPFFMATDNGYRGPCPSGALHTYQFEVHALDVAILPTVTTASTPPEVQAQIVAHSLAKGDLTGTSSATRSGQ